MPRHPLALLLALALGVAWDSAPAQAQTAPAPTTPPAPGQASPGQAQPAQGQAQPAQAQPAQDDWPDPGPFAQWRVRVSGGAGITSNFDETYFALALGAGVFLLDGLELGLDAEQWLGSGPLVTRLSPQLRYVFWFVPVLTPYLGAFYRHWFIGDGLDDVDTAGGRVGLFLARGMFVVGGGAVLEQAFTGCDEDCFSVYPELVLSFSF